MNGSAALTMFVHGESGTGKSRLIDTMPSPRLILDAEGRARHLPSQPKVWWDPDREEPPSAGDWQTCVVNVMKFETVPKVYQWLASGQHAFKSVAVDSLMEVQKRFLDELVGFNQITQQDWNAVLRRLEKVVRDYRDLPLHPAVSTDVVVFTCGTVNSDGVMRPLLQGQLRQTLPYYFDVVGYLYVASLPEEHGGGISRQLLVQPTPNATAKDGTDKLGTVIAQPNLSEIYRQIQPQPGGTDG